MTETPETTTNTPTHDDGISTVAFIGLGTMGGPMAANLVTAGRRVLGVDLSDQARAKATENGITVAESTAAAVAEADAVITILPAGKHVRSVMEGEDGILAHARPGTLIIDSSTVDIETSQWCHDQAAERGLQFADVPVSGGVPGAVEGTLTAMLGGSPEATARAASLFAPMASRIIEAGGPTMGIAAKICNNMMLYINLLSTAEGTQLADHLGLDPRVFRQIATVSSGRSFPLDVWHPLPGVVESSASNRGFAADFPVTGALKDISLALSAGEMTGVKLVGAQLVADQFQELIDEGLGDKDCSLIIKHTSPDGTVRGFDADESPRG